MSGDVITIGPDAAAGDAWALMELERIRHLVVVEGRRLLGMLSERDLGGAKGRSLRQGRTVRELMTPRVVSAKPDTTLRQAANLMRGRLIGALPVLDEGRVVGIVTATDVLEELGRGSSRPAVRATRQSMRLPPTSARQAAARRAGAAKRAARASRRSRKSAKSGRAPHAGGNETAPSDVVKITGRITPALGRTRVRRADSPQRASLPARVARAAKRVAGRTATAAIPAYVRSTGAVLDAADADYLRRKLGRKLGKFAAAIERASVRVEDVNGPRGGVDRRCQIKVVLSGLPSVVIDERHHSVQAAMDRALARAERAVRQAVNRRRTKPLKPRRYGARAAA